MLNCLYCDKELVGNQRLFCCHQHNSNWHHRKSGYKFSANYRSKNIRNYLAQLRSYHNRKDTLSLDLLETIYNKQNGKCAISGVDLTYIQGQGKCNTNTSIDRINSSIGYEPDNIQLVCYKVNIMKGESSAEELKDWCKRITG